MMTADAALPLKKAIINRLRDNGIAGGRVYDRAPAKLVFPYTTLGPFDALTEAGDDYEGSDTTLQIDVWSRGTGMVVASVEIMQLGRAVRAALLQGESVVLDEDQRMVSLSVDRISYTRDPDGETERAIVTVRARTEPAA